MSGARDPSSVLRSFAGIAMRDTVALRSVVGIAARDSGNVLRSLSGGGAFSATLSPSDLYAYGYSAGSPQFTTGEAATIAITGGVPPYTVTWIFGDIEWSAVFPTSTTTRMRSPPLTGGSESFTTVYASVEDANEATVETNAISLFASNAYGGLS